MRIDLLGTAASAIDEKQSTGAAPPSSGKTSASAIGVPEDTTTLSSGALSVASLTTQALQMSPSSGAKVDALQQAVSSGQYSLEPNRIAEAMLNESA